MDLEQFEKHGECIKWFCDNADKGVWTTGTKSKWYITHIPEWSITQPYVPNDEYAEFRKAQADGKVIQFKSKTVCSLVDAQKGHTFGNADVLKDSYCIKPDEPKFKVGDWIREQSGEIWQLGHTVIDGSHVDTYCELWRPQEGEWVCYKEIGSHVTQYTVRQYEDWMEDIDSLAPLEFMNTLKGN